MGFAELVAWAEPCSSWRLWERIRFPASSCSQRLLTFLASVTPGPCDTDAPAPRLRLGSPLANPGHSPPLRIPNAVMLENVPFAVAGGVAPGSGDQDVAILAGPFRPPSLQETHTLT